MNTIQQEFNLALNSIKAEDAKFDPIKAQFNELKTVIESNFKINRTEKRWMRSSKITVRDFVVEIVNKLIYNEENFLLIRIQNEKYIMGFGQIGELKNKLYFISGRHMEGIKSKDTIVYTDSGFYGDMYYSTERKLTLVQLFSNLIRNNKEHLVK